MKKHHTEEQILGILKEEPASSGVAPVFATPGGNGELSLVVEDDAADRDTVVAVLTERHYIES